MKYNYKKRPYLCVVLSSIPNDGVDTKKKGWVSQENTKLKETSWFVDNVSNKLMAESHVVIDILNRNLVKNRYQETIDKETLVNFYISKYGEKIVQAITEFYKKYPEYVDDAMQKEGLTLDSVELASKLENNNINLNNLIEDGKNNIN